MRRPPSSVRRAIINELKSIYQIPSSSPSGLYGGKSALKEDLSWISGHFYQGTKIYITYWINYIKGPNPTVNSGVHQILGHRYQRTKVSISDDPSQPCSMLEPPQRCPVRFYRLRTQVPWTKGLQVPSSQININFIPPRKIRLTGPVMSYGVR